MFIFLWFHLPVVADEVVWRPRAVLQPCPAVRSPAAGRQAWHWSARWQKERRMLDACGSPPAMAVTSVDAARDGAQSWPCGGTMARAITQHNDDT